MVERSRDRFESLDDLIFSAHFVGFDTKEGLVEHILKSLREQNNGINFDQSKVELIPKSDTGKVSTGDRDSGGWGREVKYQIRYDGHSINGCYADFSEQQPDQGQKFSKWSVQVGEIPNEIDPVDGLITRARHS